MIVMASIVTLSRASFLHSMAAPMVMKSAGSMPPPPLVIGNKTFENSELRITAQLVRQATSNYLSNHPSMAGSFLRLAFHDGATREQIDDTSFSGGPNGSIRYELEWSENRGLSKPLQVVNTIYNELESETALSFSDCIALVAVESLKFAGGPNIHIKLGRKDTTNPDNRKRKNILRGETDRSIVDTTLPSAALDSDGLRLYFGALGLSEKELVAISGAHDLGRHVTLLDMPTSCLKNLSRQCLEEAPVLMPFVSDDPDHFDSLP